MATAACRSTLEQVPFLERRSALLVLPVAAPVHTFSLYSFRDFFLKVKIFFPQATLLS